MKLTKKRELPMSEPKNIYIITIDQQYIRDSQIYTGKLPTDYDEDIYEDDEHWKDFFPCHYVGYVYASSSKEALLAAHQKYPQFDPGMFWVEEAEPQQ